MLLREMINNVPETSTLQLVFACMIGIEGSNSTCQAVIESPTNKLKKYVLEKQTLENRDSLYYVVKYFVEEEFLAVTVGSKKIRYMTLGNALITEGMQPISFENCYMKCLTILQTNKISLLPWLFLYTTYCKNILNAKISNTLLMQYGRAAVRPSVIDAVAADFTQYFKTTSSAGFSFRDNSNDNLIGWIMSSFGFYIKGTGVLSQYAKETDQDGLIAGGDGETTALDLRPAKQTKKKTSLEFVALATKIAKASKVLYAHNGSEIAIYDIFTQYNSMRVNQIVNDVKTALAPYTAYISVVSTWGQVDVDYTNAKQKKCNRDNVTNVMQILVQHPISIQEVNKLYNQAKIADDSRAFDKIGDSYAVKNGVSLFSSPLRSIKSSAKNSDIFYDLYVGYTALREFMNYLNDNEIDPLSIPPDIFRDIQAPRRYHSLEYYLKYKPDIDELRAEALNRTLPKPAIKTNDEVYDMIVAGNVGVSDSKTRYILNETSLLDVKYAVEHIRTFNQQDGILSSMTQQLFKSTDSYIKEIDAMIVENIDLINSKNTYTLQLLWSDKNKRTAATLRKLNAPLDAKLKSLIESKEIPLEQLQDCDITVGNGTKVKITNRVYPVSLHYTKDNIVTWLTDEFIDTSTPELRRLVATTYGALNGTANLVLTGGIKEWPDVFRRTVCYALSSYVASSSFIELSVNNKELQEKIALTFVSVLEETMKQEGHPVIKDIYYNLDADTLEQEFDYVDPVYRTDRIMAIHNCYSVLCYDNAQNDFEILSFLFMVAKRYSYYYHTNRMILGKVRLHYNGAITAERVDSLNKAQATNAKYVDDGDNGVIIRAAVYLDYLESARIVSDIDYMPKLAMEDNYLQPLNASHDTADYLKRMKLQLINTHNAYVMAHRDVYECFDKLKCSIHRLYDKSCRKTSYAINPDLRKVLSKASVDIRKKQYSDINHARIASILKANSITDEDGYVLDYGTLYTNTAGAYLHKNGYWVMITNQEYSKYEIMAATNLSVIEGVLNRVYG